MYSRVRLHNSPKVEEAGLCPGCIRTTTVPLNGGPLSQEEICQALNNIEARMQEVQAALIHDQSKTAHLEKKLRGGSVILS